MKAKIELWTYRLFKNQTLYIEEVLQRSYAPGAPPEGGEKNPVMVAAGKKAALPRAAGAYTFDQHISGKPAGIREIALAVEEFVTGLDAAIEEAPKKFYVAYRTSKNIACMKVQRQEVILYLKLDPTKVGGPSGISRNVSNIGHYGTGDLEVTLKSRDDFEAAKPFIRMAYQEVGGSAPNQGMQPSRPYFGASQYPGRVCTLATSGWPPTCTMMWWKPPSSLLLGL
jgi:predicted transport protein